MFGTIRKHQTWLWVVIIVAMIIGLVIYFSPSATTGGGPTSDLNFGSIDGQKISRVDFLNAQREAMLLYLLSTGRRPDAASGFDIERETYQRLFFIKKIKDHNIHVDEDSVARAANNILAQFGQGRPVPLQRFEEQVLKPHIGATTEDFARYLRHQLGLQQLVSVIGMGGELVTPQEAERLYARERQEISAQVVFFSGSNYQTSVTAPTPATLREFYTNNTHEYRLPERVQLSYVSFPASNYLAQADAELAADTNLSAMVEQAYQQRGTNFYSDAASPEEARQRIREEFRMDRALFKAKQAADSFAGVLFDQETLLTENMVRLAQTNGLPVHTTAPFDAQTGPTELNLGGNLAPLAFRLTPEEPFIDRAIVGEDAVYVIGLAKQIPSEVPPFESIEDRVLADYKRTQAATTARRAGGDFAQTLSAGLAAGKTFAAVAAESKVKPVLIERFSRSTEDLPQLAGRVNLYQFGQVAFSTDPGKASDFSPTADGGFVVFVEKRLPIDPEKMKAEMPEFVKTLRQARRQEAVEAWLQREGSRSMMETPLMQPRGPRAGS